MQWQGKGRVSVGGLSGHTGHLAWQDLQAEAMVAMVAGVVAVAMTATVVEATGLMPPTALPTVDVGAGHGASHTRGTKTDWEAQAGDL